MLLVSYLVIPRPQNRVCFTKIYFVPLAKCPTIEQLKWYKDNGPKQFLKGRFCKKDTKNNTEIGGLHLYSGRRAENLNNSCAKRTCIRYLSSTWPKKGAYLTHSAQNLGIGAHSVPQSMVVAQSVQNTPFPRHRKL